MRREAVLSSRIENTQAGMSDLFFFEADETEPPRAPPEHLLCPDRATRDRFLAQLLGFINPQWYKAAAMFELLPAWLRFLESRRLIDAEQHMKTYQEIEQLIPAMHRIWDRHPGDPNPRHGLQTCWGQVESGSLA
jgi:Fic/DOC family N-terminal